MPRWSRFIASFDPRGRLSASTYRRIVVQACLIAVCLLCLTIWLGAQGVRVGAILAVAGTLGVVLRVLAATARRLHDRDRSAAWLGIGGAVLGTSFAPIEDAAERYPLAVIAVVATILGFSAWLFVETVLRSGSPGPNRFGPAPDA